MSLDSKIPEGPISEKWSNFKFHAKLVNPSNRRKYHVIVVGSGLAGASAAASLAEQGYNISCFCYQDSPRRAHSIAAQGGINAAKNYQNDGDSIYRLFYDTVKGGDFRSREANVYRLAEVSVNIIDQCVAQGVPFAREYGGLLANRSFGGAQVSRTFYARGQTGQQLLLGAYSALERQIALGKVKMYTRREMLDLVKIDGSAKGIIVRNLLTGDIERYSADAVLLCTGGYGNVFYLSTNAQGCSVTAAYRCYKRGAGFANPCFTQIHPTCIPQHGDQQSKLTLMSESLRNDGRVWVPKKKEDCTKKPSEIAEEDRDYYLERKYPSFGNLAPRDISSRAAKEACDDGRGVGPAVGGERRGVYLDFADAIKRDGLKTVKEKYGNLFDMYERITGENAYETPMRIYPASHYTMGGLWVDYTLESTIPGLFVLGEANFSDHGANRLGASALMQGLADGYFVIPYTLPNYLDGPSRIRRSRKECPRPNQEIDEHQGHAKPPPLPYEARQDYVGILRYGALGGKPQEGSGTHPAGSRRVLERPQDCRRRKHAQQRTRTRGSRCRLPRIRRSDGSRRPRKKGKLRRTLPRRAPDGRRRSKAQRRRILVRRSLDVRRRRQTAAPRKGTHNARRSKARRPLV